MPIRRLTNHWIRVSELRRADYLTNIPNIYGVYEYADRKKRVIYVGAGEIRRRLRDHSVYQPRNNRPGKHCLVDRQHYFRYQLTGSSSRAYSWERRLLEWYDENACWPRCNSKGGGGGRRPV